MPQQLLDTLRASAPSRIAGEPAVALLSAGWEDSAWFEHTFLADEMGIPLVRSSDLSVQGGKLLRHLGSETHPIDVLYARMDEDMLLSSMGYDGVPLRSGLLESVTAGALTIANALGNGIGDDKAIYAYVPAMIEYYLGEKPALAQVPTWICAERAQRDYVLDNLADLVVKPIDGSGGNGVIIGPDASDEALETRRRELLSQPERYIAQQTVALSTPSDVRRGGYVPASRRPACLCSPAAGTRRLGHGARDAGRADPGRQPGIADRQFVVRRRKQGHLDTHRRPDRGRLEPAGNSHRA